MDEGLLARERHPARPALRRVGPTALPPREAGDDEAHRLVHAGLQELMEKGSVEPRVADIVRRAGLSNKAFYRHFRSKDDLLLAVLEEGMRLRVEEFERRLAGAGGPVERVRTWVRCVVEQALVPELARATRPLLVNQGRLLESLGDELWAQADRLRAPLVLALREAVASGELAQADPERDADVVYHLAMGWMHGRVIARAPASPEEAERVVEFAMRGLHAASRS